jgi:hypothetical protein
MAETPYKNIPQGTGGFIAHNPYEDLSMSISHILAR